MDELQPVEKYKRYKNKEARKLYNRNYNRIYMRKYRKTHPNYKSFKKGYPKKTRKRALIKIANDKNNGKIACMDCGYDKNIDLLEINHINGGGREELKTIRCIQLYRNIIHGKRTTDDLNILCRLCNTNHFIKLKYGAEFKVTFI